jgi:hypothetical protein
MGDTVTPLLLRLLQQSSGTEVVLPKTRRF